MRIRTASYYVLFALALAAFSPWPVVAAERAVLTAYAANGGEVTISDAGGTYLKLGMAAWGPSWAYSGVSGQPKNEGGAAVAALGGKLGGTGVPFRVAFRAEQKSPKQLQISYELEAQADSALTLICVDLAPGKTFEGRDAAVEADGKATKARFPLDKRGLGKKIDTVRLTDKAGQATVVRFSPAIDVASDGSARVVLAEGNLPGKQARRLTITVDLPTAANWYPSVADIPDLTGIETWYRWQSSGATGTSMLGMEDWLEAPAGKHGRILAEGDSLMYNGKPIKLWGLNLCYGTCAPEKSLADKRAALYRKYGINSVRLHKWADGPGWAGIQSKESFVEFDPKALDLMDYQVAKFKEAGIYVKLSAHFGSQKLAPADAKYVPFLNELAEGPKGKGKGREDRVTTPHSAVHYSPELQQVQIMQMVNLLKHKNAYTGLTYADDPAVAYLEIINEQSIMFFSSMAPLKASPTLRKQVGARFCEWLKQKYGSQAKLAAVWGQKAFDSFGSEGFKTDGEQLDMGNILPLGNPWFWDPEQLSSTQAFRKQRLLDSLEFLYVLQNEFYDRYVKAMREAGYKGEIVSSNWQAGRAFSHFANLHSDARIGTVDRHNYFGGAANHSMLAKAGSGMLSSGLQQVAGRPFMLSEWIHVAPNEMGTEGVAILGAYGMGLQGWDVSYIFQNRDPGGFLDKINRDRWEVAAPQVLGVFPAVSRHIHRGDIRPADVVAVRNVHVPSLFAGKIGFDDKVVQGYDDKELTSSKVPAAALAVAHCTVNFTKTYQETPTFEIAPFVKNGQIVSSTGELRWKEADGGPGGFFTINTSGTKAVVGFAQGQTAALGTVTIEPQSGYGAIYVTARGRDETLDTGREALIVAIARARNTGMKFTPNGDRLLASGDEPIVMEPVKARITLGRAMEVIALDHDGKATNKRLPVQNGTVTIDGARDKTPYYLVRFGR